MAETAKINIDDSILVEQCRAGDSAAMERLIFKYQNRIFNAILKICGNSDDAAELTQDTFVKVIENIDRFQRRSSVYTWIFRIAINLTLNYCKKGVKLGIKSLDSESRQDDSGTRQLLKEFLQDEASPDPSEAAVNKELCGIIENAIMELDDSHRAVIVLRDIEGMDYQTIADVLDIELGTVRSRLSRARNNLKDILEMKL